MQDPNWQQTSLSAPYMFAEENLYLEIATLDIIVSADILPLLMTGVRMKLENNQSLEPP